MDFYHMLDYVERYRIWIDIWNVDPGFPIFGFIQESFLFKFLPNQGSWIGAEYIDLRNIQV